MMPGKIRFVRTSALPFAIKKRPTTTSTARRRANSIANNPKQSRTLTAKSKRAAWWTRSWRSLARKSLTPTGQTIREPSLWISSSAVSCP
ncbi:unnamed protein product [Cladocopium goreaui]|uniref:Uncharacterized protein n=1 Tax=Cladocopium goreaui TaxID=2562237 RepID=A0A9P1CW49_9DINO|nr:unnamed protein product [Cladocopium goreaui]